ncbi:MAG: hypothetical protein IPG76_22885 [Acidobacteria bacterium]|nr:hypothetical protein [Acidobacteriota bacterium]
MTATDNETPPATDSKEIEVRVNNLQPRIAFMGEQNINVGDSIRVETREIEDRDGGALNFEWDIVQAPQSAPPSHQVRLNYKTGSGADGSSISIPTTAEYAGTWIFRLKAGDNEFEVDNFTATEKFKVVVDAQPVARISGPAPARVGSIFGFPLTLDGGGSEDPDSMTHTTLEPPLDVSPPIICRVWYLTDAPTNYPDIISLGRVNEALNIEATNISIVIPASRRLRPGIYTFQLKVEDGEHNFAYDNYQIEIIDESSALLQ